MSRSDATDADELPSVGDRVVDLDTGDRLLVIDVFPETASRDRRIEATGRTVASHNPEYDEDDPVVTTAYVEEVAGLSVADLKAFKRGEGDDVLRAYDFPAGRLAADVGAGQA